MSYQQYAPYPVGPGQGADPYGGSYGGYGADPGYVSYGGGPAYGSSDEIRTIFITGFPEDIKERELINMCRFLPDFEV